VYIVLISIHGLIRGRDLELGRDADTGGQIQYVVELARALADSDDVEHVDLVTRRVVDPNVDDDYEAQYEGLADKARIVRIDAGPDEYLPKEQLWDHLDAFADNLMLMLNAQPRLPDIVHSHYADAGYVGVRVSNRLGIPLVHTGHSLGRDKRRRLIATGMTRETIEQRFNMRRRVDAEENALANASLVIASTDNEIEQQYAAYDYYRPEQMKVVAPGTDLSRFQAPAADDAPSAFEELLPRFLRKTDRPMVLALSRPDERKNIRTLVKAFGESNRLRDIANLVIVAGIRDDIRDLDSGPQHVLTELLLMIDYYNLYGKVALPKSHRFEQVPDIYRAAARSRGVFVNPALTEPFGLTILEAAASGLPVVATENGGPVDIIANCKNGLLVDPLDSGAMANAILEILEDSRKHKKFAQAGIANVPRHYSWKAHAEKYMQAIRSLAAKRKPRKPRQSRKESWRYRDSAVFTDIDQNLLGSTVGLARLTELMRKHHSRTVFGIATGRGLTSALSAIKAHKIPRPDVLITSLGTEIRYGPNLIEDEFWAEHIDFMWNPRAIRRVLSEFEGIEPQPRQNQSAFKISYYYDPAIAPSLDEINAELHRDELTVNVLHSFGQFLDIVPKRASKGEALRYFARSSGTALRRILVAGGSGADEDMMRGNTLAVVVANRHHEELSGLDERDDIYFASKPHALGIIEAIEHYGFFDDDGSATAA
jgi:sucrose-phosphate synthase